VISALVGELRKLSELIVICQNQSQKVDLMVLKWGVGGSWNRGTEMGSHGSL